MAKQKLKKVGFVIANDREEFLHNSKSEPGLYDARSWSLIPDLAKVYRTRALALDEVKKMALPYQVWVLVLFESKGQFAVGSDDETKPSWLE